MNYKKKYEEALERARDLMINQNPPAFDKHLIEIVFPELKETEDERIRKAIKKALQVRCDGSRIISDEPVTLEEAIAWLEKQGKQKQTWKPNAAQLIVIKDLIEDKNTSKVNKVILRGMFDEFKQFTNTNKREIDDAYLQGICDAKHEIEKQGEQTQLDYVHADIPQKDFAPIEPKFKPGNWVVNNVCLPMQIASIKDGMYIFTKGDAMSVLFIDGNYHLWTIHDAMDGDVLAAKDGRPFIFTGEFDVRDDNPTAYCGINSSDKFITGMGSHWTFKNGIKPATKEQQDLLFAKMKEAGYEWDADKKELKKIKIKSKNLEPKTLNADKVIEWLKITINERAENYGVYNETRLILPYNSIEDLINDFKEDFGL